MESQLCSDGGVLSPSLCPPGVPSPTCGVWWNGALAWSLQPSSSLARLSPRHQQDVKPGYWPDSSMTVCSTSTKPSRGAGDLSLSPSCILGQDRDERVSFVKADRERVLPFAEWPFEHGLSLEWDLAHRACSEPWVHSTALRREVCVEAYTRDPCTRREIRSL